MHQLKFELSQILSNQIAPHQIEYGCISFEGTETGDTIEEDQNSPHCK